MRASTWRLTLRTPLSLPICLIQGRRLAIEAFFSLSRRASVTNWRSDIPSLAALDLARRTMLSGISSVVFMSRYSDILGGGVKGLLMEGISFAGNGGYFSGLE